MIDELRLASPTEHHLRWAGAGPETRGGIQDPQVFGMASCLLAVAPERLRECRPIACALEQTSFMHP